MADHFAITNRTRAYYMAMLHMSAFHRVCGIRSVFLSEMAICGIRGHRPEPNPLIAKYDGSPEPVYLRFCVCGKAIKVSPPAQ